MLGVQPVEFCFHKLMNSCLETLPFLSVSIRSRRFLVYSSAAATLFCFELAVPLGVPVDFWGAVPANSLELTLSSGGLADFGTPVPTIAPAKTRAAIIDTIVRLSTMIT